MTELAPSFDWSVVIDLNERPLFDETAIRELLIKIGPPPAAAEKVEAMAFKLSELGKSFAFDLWHQGCPSASVEQQQAEKLAAALGAALTLAGFGIDEQPSSTALLPMFGPGGLFASAAARGEPNGKAATMNALRAVYLLRLDALAMVRQRGKRRAMKPPKAGRAADTAIKRLVASIAEVYLDAWGRVPTVARSNAAATSGQPTGTFVALMVAVADELRRRGVRFSATAESLQKHWRSLPPDERQRLDMAEKGSQPV
jgi:hypothetical protein